MNMELAPKSLVSCGSIPWILCGKLENRRKLKWNRWPRCHWLHLCLVHYGSEQPIGETSNYSFNCELGSNWMSEWPSKRVNGRVSKWPSTFVPIFGCSEPLCNDWWNQFLTQHRNANRITAPVKKRMNDANGMRRQEEGGEDHKWWHSETEDSCEKSDRVTDFIRIWKNEAAKTDASMGNPERRTRWQKELRCDASKGEIVSLSKHRFKTDWFKEASCRYKSDRNTSFDLLVTSLDLWMIIALCAFSLPLSLIILSSWRKVLLEAQILGRERERVKSILLFPPSYLRLILKTAKRRAALAFFLQKKIEDPAEKSSGLRITLDGGSHRLRNSQREKIKNAR